MQSIKCECSKLDIDNNLFYFIDIKLLIVGTVFVQLRKNLGKPGKGTFLKRIRENLENSGNFLTIFKTSGNFLLPNISDQIGGALRINQ